MAQSEHVGAGPELASLMEVNLVTEGEVSVDITVLLTYTVTVNTRANQLRITDDKLWLINQPAVISYRALNVS